MEEVQLRKLLQLFKEGKLKEEDLLKRLKELPFSELGFAKLDFHRSLRKGIPEVIFGEGKTLKELEEIIKKMLKARMNVFATRLEEEIAKKLKKRFKDALYNSRGRVFKIIRNKIEISGKGTVLVISAGTADIGVAEEARETLEFLGNNVQVLYDVGVAGLHRLLKHREVIEDARVIIVVAGMEGALPSVVAGLVSKPVIGVPTSIGYGVHLAGLSSLFGMLTSCANGLCVVNIDNGFGAGCFASLINHL